MGSRERRMAKREAAANALEKHSGPVMDMLGQVVHDLAAEQEGLKQFEADMQLAAELAYRLDKAVTLADPLLEALDGIVCFFVALGAIGIWRAAARRDQLRGARLDRLQARLRKRGASMAPVMRRKLERRIARLSAP